MSTAEWTLILALFGPLIGLGWVHGVQCLVELYKDIRAGRWR